MSIPNSINAVYHLDASESEQIKTNWQKKTKWDDRVYLIMAVASVALTLLGMAMLPVCAILPPLVVILVPLGTVAMVAGLGLFFFFILKSGSAARIGNPQNAEFILQQLRTAGLEWHLNDMRQMYTIRDVDDYAKYFLFPKNAVEETKNIIKEYDLLKLKLNSFTLYKKDNAIEQTTRQNLITLEQTAQKELQDLNQRWIAYRNEHIIPFLPNL